LGAVKRAVCFRERTAEGAVLEARRRRGGMRSIVVVVWIVVEAVGGD